MQIEKNEWHVVLLLQKDSNYSASRPSENSLFWESVELALVKGLAKVGGGDAFPEANIRNEMICPGAIETNKPTNNKLKTTRTKIYPRLFPEK